MDLTSLGSFGAALVMSGAELGAAPPAKAQLYWLSVPAYAGLGYLWTLLLRGNPLGLTNLYWNAITNWGNIAVGAWFGEQLTGTQFVGAALITTGIILLGQ